MIYEQLLAYGWPGLFLAVWVGLCVGSFLNVVIYRLPVMLHREWEVEARTLLNLTGNMPDSKPFNLLVPRSGCPACGHLITAWQNIPVFSWVFLKAKCANCNSSISIRYPLVELLGGVLTVWGLSLFGFTWLGLAVLLYAWTLLALTFIDYDTQLLPDQLTLPLLWLGLITNLFGGFTDLPSAIIGAIAGYLFLWSTYWVFKLITGKEGMGYGDFKLYAAIGAWLGWQVLPAVILIASIVGLLYALFTLLTGNRQSAQPIPFGPFLAVSGWVSLVARDSVMALFLA
ncbi:MAG: A24 family peptidase [Gammaproteobacteria bacterium]|nr:A24 family peptidase [Gammaproteobacteria bacterium]